MLLKSRTKRQSLTSQDEWLDEPLEDGNRLLRILPMAIISLMLVAAFGLAGNILGRNADARVSEASVAGPDLADAAALLGASTSLDGKGSLPADGYTIASINLSALHRQTVITDAKGDFADPDQASLPASPAVAAPIPKPKPATLAHLNAGKPIKITPVSAEPDSMDQQPATARLLVKPAAPATVDTAAITPSMKAQFLAAHRVRSAEENCLARAIYFEARSEPDLGQLAVAKVILNRVKSPDFPKTICGVVYQGSENRNSCQFSFACDGVTSAIKQPEAWAHAKMIADRALANDPSVAMLGGAVNYHADYVNPRWSKSMRRLIRIGHHIFYAKREDG